MGPVTGDRETRVALLSMFKQKSERWSPIIRHLGVFLGNLLVGLFAVLFSGSMNKSKFGINER